MSYRSLRECANDLEKHGRLVRIRTEVDPDLEMAEIHRRIFDAGGPAILFERVKGSPFQAISNLYGTFGRTEFIFRHTLEKVRKVIELKADPSRFFRQPFRYASAPLTAVSALPMKNIGPVPVLYGRTTVSRLPQIKSWPMDGGAFVTLPQVMTLPPGVSSMMQSNLGMYRVQLSGNDYVPDAEIGMHYQLHRGIGIHQSMHMAADVPFRCSIFVGGPPSHAFSAIMPLPEGISELIFAGMLVGRRFPYARKNGHLLSADADFVITGTIRKSGKKPEGPFGDHLGYYSLAHDFPVMEVEQVYHRRDPLWHFTVVGRPPQEDSSFGYLIHQLVRLLTPQEFPGVKEINAVDAAGVHPLLLAVGSERYMPFREHDGPEEILTQANRILGTGQTSLAKFLIIAADSHGVSAKDIPGFFQHVLERVDWMRDLHFQTRTTIDTLDYSGSGWNEGSKVVIACAGAPKRTLAHELPGNLTLPEGFSAPKLALPGALIVRGPKFTMESGYAAPPMLAAHFEQFQPEGIPLVVIADDSDFTAAGLNNFLWVTFTRANPSHDLYGSAASVVHKHWGCAGPLLIDARIKPHHAPPLETDPAISKKIDRLFGPGGELHGLD